MAFSIAVLHHWHHGGDDISVHPDEATAINTLYPRVVDSWDNIRCSDGSWCPVPDCTGVPADVATLTRADAITTYFAHRPDVVENIDHYTYEVEYPAPPKRVKHPDTTAPVNHDDVTGRLHITFTDADEVFATTEPDEPLIYRDMPFRAAVYLTRDTNSTWTPAAKTDPSLTHQLHGRRARNVSRIYAKPLMGAILHTVAKNWTPALGKRAHHASAVRDLHNLTDRQAQLLAELETITTKTAPLWETVRNYTGPTSPAD